MDAWTRDDGVTRGRIRPARWTPAESSAYVLCLGSDLEGDVQPLAEGDYVEWSQPGDLTSNTVMRFTARTRGPTEVPQVVRVNTASSGAYTITIGSTDYTYTAGGSDTIVSIAAGLAALVNAGSQATALLVGTANMVQLNGLGTEVVTLTGAMTLATFSWWARMYIDTNLRFEQRILPGYQRDRIDGGAMTRAEVIAGGDHDIKFRLQLDCDVSSVGVELELPAFYVDAVAIGTT